MTRLNYQTTVIYCSVHVRRWKQTRLIQTYTIKRERERERERERARARERKKEKERERRPRMDGNDRECDQKREGGRDCSCTYI